MPVPTTLEECFAALDEMLGDEDKAFIDQAEDPKRMIAFHHSLGQHLRNEWGLWSNSELKNHFQTRQAVVHPDDMSGLILEEYWRYRHRGPTAWDRITDD
jgi:hypothetical protein